MDTRLLFAIAAAAVLASASLAAAGPQTYQNSPFDIQGQAQQCKVVGNVVELTDFTGTINGVQGTWKLIVVGIVQGDVPCHGPIEGPYGVTSRPGTRVTGMAYK